jgi:hypothetical protein
MMGTVVGFFEHGYEPWGFPGISAENVRYLHCVWQLRFSCIRMGRSAERGFTLADNPYSRSDARIVEGRRSGQNPQQQYELIPVVTAARIDSPQCNLLLPLDKTSPSLSHTETCGITGTRRNVNSWLDSRKTGYRTDTWHSLYILGINF